ncbi:alpha/beta hydrolase [Micromonospora sp. M12]
MLVHGAWADGSSWDKVAAKLQHDGYRVVTPPNLLSGVKNDADNLRAYLDTITGPVVLVGHSYGGMVISNAALGDKDVKALVYVDAYIPEQHDSVYSLTSASRARSSRPTRPPSSTRSRSPARTRTTPTSTSSRRSSARRSPTRASPPRTSRYSPPGNAPGLQRPDRRGRRAGLAHHPSWSVVGKQDAVIPAAQQIAMSKRAKAHTIEINAPICPWSPPRARSPTRSRPPQRRPTRHHTGRGIAHRDATAAFASPLRYEYSRYFVVVSRSPWPRGPVGLTRPRLLPMSRGPVRRSSGPPPG